MAASAVAGAPIHRAPSGFPERDPDLLTQNLDVMSGHAEKTELLGYGPTCQASHRSQHGRSSDAYETTTQIREHVKLTHPPGRTVPYGTRETSQSIDLDHLQPYDSLGPPGQTNTQNLMPLSRYGHRLKTHARGWKVRRIDAKTIEWTTPHGFVLHVNLTGTHRISKGQ